MDSCPNQSRIFTYRVYSKTRIYFVVASIIHMKNMFAFKFSVYPRCSTHHHPGSTRTVRLLHVVATVNTQISLTAITPSINIDMPWLWPTFLRPREIISISCHGARHWRAYVRENRAMARLAQKWKFVCLCIHACVKPSKTCPNNTRAADLFRFSSSPRLFPIALLFPAPLLVHNVVHAWP
jgi:hypothetical protein